MANPDLPSTQDIVNIMAMRFTVTPPDVADKLRRVKFDVTRRMDHREWRLTQAEQDNEIDPQLETSYAWNALPWDYANDDPEPNPGQRNDESLAPLPGGHMFTIDGPGWERLSKAAPLDVVMWHYSNFQEFVRVRFDGHKPTGTFSGSRSSSHVPWYARVYVVYVDATVGWVRGLNGGENVIAPGFRAIGVLP